MAQFVVPTTSEARLRAGFEEICGNAAAVAVMNWEPQITSSDMDPEKIVVENTNIVPSGHKAKPIPGKEELTGTIDSQNDADGLLIGWLSSLRNIGPVETLGGGAFRYAAGRSLSTPVPTVTWEQDRNDGVIDANVACATTAVNTTVANGAAMITSTEWAGAFQTLWQDAIELHPNPGTGTIFPRGVAEQYLERPDGAASTLSLQLVDLFTDVAGVTRAVFLASVGQTTVLTGTWTVGAGTSAFAGTGAAAESEIIPGDILDVEGQLLEVATVTDDDTFTTVATHTAGAAGATLVREYGTENQASIFFSTTDPGLNNTGLPTYRTLFNSSGGRMGNVDTSGDRVEINLDDTAGIVGGVAAGVGTVGVVAGSATITGAGTTFLADLTIGDFVTTPVETTGKRILSITSDLVATTDSNFGTTEAAVTLTRRPIPVISLGADISVTSTSTTITGIGTTFLTDLSIGSAFRTVGGQVRRISTITSDLIADAHYDFATTEANVEGFTFYEWTAGRERSSWTAAVHPSGPFSEVNSSVFVAFSTTTVPEQEFLLAQSFEIAFTAGREPVSGLGSVKGVGSFDSGSSEGTATLITRKINADIRKAILAQEDVRARIVCSTGKTIGSSVEEFVWEFVLHFQPAGKPAGIPDATTNEDTLAGALFDDPTDVEFPDAVTLIVTSNREFPLATS